MKFLILLTGGRSGSDLLQSLLDSHPQILQFPGFFRFDKPFINILNEKNPQKMSEMFCDLNPHFFDSRIEWEERPDIGERHDMLGKNRDEFYKFSEEIFKKSFIYFYQKSKKKKIDILIALHKSYAKTSNQNLSKKKIIIIHLHLIEHFKRFIKTYDKFNNFKIVLTLRDPLVSLCSTVKHWKKFYIGKFLHTKSIFENIDMHVNIWNDLYEFRKKLSVVQLENLHLKSNKVLKELCKLLKINYRNSLKKSTYFNKIWWGDAVSKKFLKGLNPKFKNKFNDNLFFEKDIHIIENKIKDVLIKFNYPLRANNKKYIKHNIFLPFKFELIVWANNLKTRNFIQFLLIPFFHIKRTLILSTKNLYTKSELPQSIGSNK